MNVPEVKVGILHAPQISIILNGDYRMKDELIHAEQSMKAEGEQIKWRGNLYTELFFQSQSHEDSFTLKDVTIGIQFHWERKENQTFKGSLHIIVNNGELVAINILPVESYLKSVISSEMSATAGLEFLKAHAVISRSWLLAQMSKEQKIHHASNTDPHNPYIRWYDHDDHTLFDVCADDHCQRYQGITRANNPNVIEAVESTCGILLMNESEICDARFSKCCGGMLEEFETCWENHHHSYLVAKRDVANAHETIDLTNPKEAEQWILTSPDSFCNTHDAKILKQIMNNYDQETPDFYRWEVTYTREELSSIVRKKTGEDFGEIIRLIPGKRGPSGRLRELTIVGTKMERTIGKELEIRRILSDTHLLSSAFIVETTATGFHIQGAGWGHGVGLCQIGAAVMGEKGYSYQEILAHYYPEAQLIKKYE